MCGLSLIGCNTGPVANVHRFGSSISNHLPVELHKFPGTTLKVHDFTKLPDPL